MTIASKLKNNESVEASDSGLEPQKQLDFAFLKSVQYKSIEAMARQLESGASINAVDEKERNALFYVGGRVDIFNYLIEKEIEVDVQDTEGNTPLFFSNNSQITKYYIDKKLLGVEHNNKLGENALHVCKTADIAEILLKNGINVNKQNNDNDAPIHAVIDRCFIDRNQIIEKIIGAGAHIDQQGNHKETALHRAVINNQYDTVQLLINKGADIQLRDENKKTALEIAVANGNSKIIEILRDKLEKIQ